MKKILIGTHNQGKFKEISSLISKKYRKISPNKLKLKSPKETGKTFVSNSKLKAEYFSNYVDYPVVSDDSGLCIRSLNNQPGVFSARLANKYGSFYKAMKYLLKRLKNKKNRSAFFVCSLSFKPKKGRTVSVLGKVEGTISNKIAGNRGFGYDPIFIPKNHKKTFGQMFKLKKVKIDHRYMAFKKLKKKIKIL
ncbi:MAG: RdgB/HAM1 family non-canonical purine NTP pyrophosphatase [Pseudomonadota bacterium]|nr:RdgB/HAM1 family non-canonical purine NTP pyrophosphatase [Pseudomonadota bacterium]